MEHHTCDFCGGVITSKRYGIAIEPIEDTKKLMNEILSNPYSYLKKEKEMEVLEICEGCKDLLDRLVKLRGKKIKKLKKQTDKMLKDFL